MTKMPKRPMHVFEIGQEVQIVEDREEIIPFFRGKIGEVVKITTAPSAILEMYYPKQPWYDIILPQSREHEEIRLILTSEFLVPILREDKTLSTWEDFEKTCGFNPQKKTQ